jgi:6-phospho-3-hexuloisomerase
VSNNESKLNWSEQLTGALEEVDTAMRLIASSDVESAVAEILQAKQIAFYAGGREGLMMRALAMRLFHAGLDVHVVGDMTVPHLGAGDLFILTCGPGNISTAEALAGVASKAGARILYFTAQPANKPAHLANVVFKIPAQTMADDKASTAVLPMGSTFEIAILILGDLLTNAVRAARGEDIEKMRSRHTNME